MGITKKSIHGHAFTNEDFIEMTRTEDIHSFVGKQRLKFVTKIIRKDNTSIQKRLLFNNNEAIKRGPKTNLMSTILKSGQTLESVYALAWK